MVPGHNDGAQLIPRRRDDWVWRTREEQITNVAHIMATAPEKLGH